MTTEIVTLPLDQITGVENIFVTEGDTGSYIPVSLFANFYNLVANQVSMYAGAIEVAASNSVIARIAAYASRDAAAATAVSAAAVQTGLQAATTSAATAATAASTTAAALSETTAATNYSNLQTSLAAITAATVVNRNLAQVTAASLANLSENLAGSTYVIHSGADSSFIYDTSKDSDGGAWRKRCQGTSWYQEPICTGLWLGQYATEALARSGDNLVISPEDINGATWSKAASSVSVNVIAAPDLTTTADKLIDSTAASSHYIGLTGALQSIAVGTMCVGVWAKAAELSIVNLYMDDGSGNSVAYDFDLVSLVMTNRNTGTGWSNPVTTITAHPTEAGWYWCQLTAYRTIATAFYVRIGLGKSGASYSFGQPNFTGTGSAGLYLWGIKAKTGTMTPYVPVSKMTGCYFQATSDNRFYQLNATSGTTEVFRGNSREFPAVVAIVTESAANRVMIYDLTVPNCPMWMVIKVLVSGVTAGGLVCYITPCCATAVNGQVGIGDNNFDFGIINFITDSSFSYVNFSKQFYGGNIANRHALKGRVSVTTSYTLAGRQIRSCASTVLPGAPIDAATGLPVPTWAVGTNTGVTVIKHDGVLAGYGDTYPTMSCCFVGKILMLGSRYGWQPHARFIDVTTITGTTFTPNDMPAIPGGGLWDEMLVTGGARSMATARSSAGLSLVKLNPLTTSSTVSLRAYANIVFGTGWQVGDARGTYLVDAQVISNNEFVSNGTFDSVTTGWTASGSSTLASVNGELQITAPGGTNFSGATQTLTLVSGKTYQVTVTSRMGTSSTNTGFSTTNTTPAINVNINNTTNSVTYTTTFTATSNSVQLTLFMNGAPAVAGTAFFDNVSVKEIAYNQELIYNGNFTTDTSGWSVVSNCTIASTNGQLVITNTATNGICKTMFSTIVGRQYQFSFSVQNGVPVSVSIVGTGTYFNNLYTPSGVYTVKFTADNTTATLSITSNGVSGTISTIDNVSVTEVLTNNELVYNGGFNFDTTGWVVQRLGSIAWSNGTIMVTNGSNGFEGCAQQINLVIGKIYQVTYTYTHSNGSGFLMVSSDLGAASNRQFAVDVLTASATKTYTFVATISSAYISASQGSSGGAGTVSYFDNISCKQVYTGMELVTNGTFNTDTSGWSTYSTSLAVVGGAMQVTNLGGGGSAGQTIVTEPGKVYAVTATHTFISGSGFSNLLVRDTSSVTLAQKSATGTASLGTVTVVFTATTVATNIFCRSEGGADVHTWDNISCKPVIADRSFKNLPLTLNGQITTTNVAEKSQLLAYSNWGLTNYLSQLYNSNLDFGTTGFHASAWVNPSVTASTTGVYNYTLGPNLVTNGSFNTNTTGWAATAAATIAAVNGQLEITAVVSGSYPQVQQFITTVVGKIYRIRVQYKAGTSPHNAGIVINNITSPYNNSFTPVANSSYQTFDKIVVATSTNISIYLFINSGSASAGTVYFDNVEMRECSASGSNLITNGYFDDAVLGWTTINGATLTATNGVARITSNGTSNGGIATNFSNILTPGKVYLFGCDLVANSAPRNIAVLLGNTFGVTYSSGAGVRINGLTGNTYTSPISIQFNGASSNNDSFDVDNCMVREVTPTGPELFPSGSNDGTSITNWLTTNGTISLNGSGQFRWTYGPTYNYGTAVYPIYTTVGRTYVVAVDLVTVSGGGSVDLRVGSDWYFSNSPGTIACIVGNRASLLFTAVNTVTYVGVKPQSGTLTTGYFDFDNFSCKELIANNLNTELVTNGSFASATGWTLPASMTVSGNKCNINNSTSEFGTQAVSFVSGKSYQITCDVVVTSGSDFRLPYDSNVNNIATVTATGTYTRTMVCYTNSSVLYFGYATSFTGSITNISVKEIITPFNELIPYPGGSYTTTSGLTVVNATAASSYNFNTSPQGITVTATSVQGRVEQGLTLTIGKTYLFSAVVKTGTASCFLSLLRGAPGVYAGITNSSTVAANGTTLVSLSFVYTALAADAILRVNTNDASGTFFVASMSCKDISYSTYEILPNPGFGNALTGWSFSGSGDITVQSGTNGKMNLTRGAGGTGGFAYMAFNTVIGKNYYFSVDTGAVSNVVRFGSTNGQGNYIALDGVTGIQTGVFTATVTTSYFSTWPLNANTTTTINAISIKEVTDGPLIPQTGGAIISNNGIDLGNGRWMISSAAQLRLYYDYTKMNGYSSYEVQVTVESMNGGGISETDFCDGNFSTTPSSGFVNSPPVGLTKYYGNRISYDNVYKFVDVLCLTNGSVIVSNIIVKEIDPATVFERTDNFGASYKLGIDFGNRPIVSVSDGTNTISTFANTYLQNGTYNKLEMTYNGFGVLNLKVNGVTYNNITSTILNTISNTYATLNVGTNVYNTNALPPDTRVCLLKFSATLPTQEQIDFMYATERMMFNPYANITMEGTDSQILGISYDDNTDIIHMVNAWGRNSFKDLIRVESEQATSVNGTPNSVSAFNGNILVTASLKAYITKPSSTLRAELKNKHAEQQGVAREYNQFVFDCITFTGTTTSGTNTITGVTSIVGTPYFGMGISGAGIPAGTYITNIVGTTYTVSANSTASATVSIGQTSFTIAAGYTTKKVLVNGSLKRGGTSVSDTTKDYKGILTDGFKETINFNATPGVSAVIVIIAIRNPI